jgi:hypothetical protein
VTPVAAGAVTRGADRGRMSAANLDGPLAVTLAVTLLVTPVAVSAVAVAQTGAAPAARTRRAGSPGALADHQPGHR